jgi:C4-dicarboxylate-binding protein DctP
VPGTWTLTGFVPDADFSQLPAFYGLPVEVVHKATDGSAAKYVNGKPAEKLGVQVLGVQVLGGWFDLGFNNWFSTKKPLNSLADLKAVFRAACGGGCRSSSCSVPARRCSPSSRASRSSVSPRT